MWTNLYFHHRKTGVDVQVVLGGVDIEKDEASDQVIPVEKVIVHEHYRETHALHNDIGEVHSPT